MEELIKRPVILVADDDPSLTDLINVVLCDIATVHIANDGREALQVAIQVRPDLIILDIMMPELAGDELLKELRSLRELDTTSIIMLTAIADQDTCISMLSAGAQDYIRKPFDTDELHARVMNLLMLQANCRKWRANFEAHTETMKTVFIDITEMKNRLKKLEELCRKIRGDNY